jgi:methylmalonyl-CoA carboxyltransferase small subunit
VKLKITIDEQTYEVEVEAVDPEARRAPPRGYVAEPAAVRVPAASAAAKPKAVEPVNEEKVCRSPVAGVVVRLVVQIDQTIQPGDVLLVLEAMKMETNITSPAGGEVSAIKVQPGDAVQVGQVVVEFR